MARNGHGGDAISCPLVGDGKGRQAVGALAENQKPSRRKKG
jgi:hypothetical protein